MCSPSTLLCSSTPDLCHHLTTESTLKSRLPAIPFTKSILKDLIAAFSIVNSFLPIHLLLLVYETHIFVLFLLHTLSYINRLLSPLLPLSIGISQRLVWASLVAQLVKNPPAWRRKWQPTPVFLPGESHGRRSLVGCSPWGHPESDTTQATWQQHCRRSRAKAGHI